MSTDLSPNPKAEGGYLALTSDPWVSVVFVLPLLIIYQFGLFVLDFEVLNGADFVTRIVYYHWSMKGVVLLNLGFVALFLAAIIRLRHRRQFRLGYFLPLLIECGLYAMLLGSVIVFVLQQASILSLTGPGDWVSIKFSNFIMSLGAGVYEEIVFRLVCIAVLEYLLVDFCNFKRSHGLVGAVVVSSLLFAGAHHIGAYGDPFTVYKFAFRAVAGVLFAVLYKVRSFAVAAYTHALYDVYVTVVT